MPVQPRPSDTFTRNNLLLGFPIVTFTPVVGGVVGTPIDLGILSSASLQKTVETLALERGDSGLITVDREIVSQLTASFEVQTFNFRWDVAQLVFGSATAVAVIADAAAAQSDNIAIPQTNPFSAFVGLNRGDINEASVEVTFRQISSEAVGTGQGGTFGETQGDFSLDQKIKAIGDVTSYLEGGVERVGDLVAGAAPGAGQIGIEIGEEDDPTTGSGAITYPAGEAPTNGDAIVVTYTPSFSTTGGDIVNLTDFVFDPVLGRVRFRHAAADASPFRLSGEGAEGTALNVAYTYNRRASTTLKPFTRNQVDGIATIRQLPDIGINFIWDVTSAQLRLTDDEIAFGAEDFGVATLLLNILDAGGSDRFGTLDISNETEAAA